jgi:hypothetical protein
MPGLNGTIDFSRPDRLAVTAGDFSVRGNSRGYHILRPNLQAGSRGDCRTAATDAEERLLILLDGVVINQSESHWSIASDLLKLYIDRGEHFTNLIRGSFRILVVDTRGEQIRLFLYSDHAASRPIFYYHDDQCLHFGAGVETLLPHIKKKTADELAMAHFMVSGHFPSGHTGIEAVKVLGPGQYLALEDSSCEMRFHYRFELNPEDRMHTREASQKLEAVLTERIMDHWRYAENPAILLSGGYDSQYIFHTIADAVDDTRRLTTITWGEDPVKRGADMAIARRTAERYGTRHIEIIKTNANWQAEYDAMFKAQNGMTDSSFYHAHELTVCKRLRSDHGIRSLIRGDECLGFGPVATTLQGALLPNSMSYPEHIPGFSAWFDDHHDVGQRYTGFLNRLISRYPCSTFDSLKDTLDYYERQHMNRNPLNYFKLNYLEVSCPLIDPDVMDVIARLPSDLRQHKQLFKRLVKAKAGRWLRIADYTNLANWHTVIGGSVEIKEFLTNEIDKLPSFFNIGFFRNQIELLTPPKARAAKHLLNNCVRPLKKVPFINAVVRSMRRNNQHADQHLRIPPEMLIIRAAVLARWNEWWIAGN